MNNSQKYTLNIELILTKDCNFRCSYCYEKDSKYQSTSIDYDTIAQLMVYLFHYHQNFPHSDVIINFWGGEPSLAIDIIERITDYYMNTPWVRFLIFTNGYSNQEKLFQIVQKCNSKQPNKFIVQISYDFYGQYNRILRGGVSSKDAVLKTIHNAIESNIPFWLKSTISLMDLQYIDLFYQEFENLYFKYGDKICFTLTPDTTSYWVCDDANENYFEEKHLPKFADKMLMITKSLYKHFRNGSFIYKNFNWFSDEVLIKRALCSAGDNYFCVDCNGDIYPCHGVAFLSQSMKQEYYLGNIKNMRSFTLFNLPFNVFQEPEKCKNCYACVCFRCNAHTLLNSFPDLTLEKNWTNHGVNDKYCQIMKIISKYVYAFNKLKEKG